MKIAILGATSHIAKGLICNFSKEDDELFLFGRNPGDITSFLDQRKIKTIKHIYTYKKFENFKYDVIVNCVGIGRPEKIKEAGYQVIQITEQFDTLVLEYLEKNRGTIYIHFSSGAVFGSQFTKPVTANTKSIIDLNSYSPKEAYSASKIISELRHRSLPEYNIIDLRVYAYFSQHIDLDSSFLMSSLAKSIIEKKTFETSPSDIVRDFVHPDDLYSMIHLSFKNGGNMAFDMYSKKPTSKFEILKYFKEKFGLKYVVNKETVPSSTGAKNIYYSKNHSAATWGYQPKYTALESLSDQFDKIIRRENG